MRTLWGLLLGFGLFFPGVELIRAFAKALGYANLSISEACLIIIMMLVAVFVVQHKPVRAPRPEVAERVCCASPPGGAGRTMICAIPTGTPGGVIPATGAAVNHG